MREEERLKMSDVFRTQLAETDNDTKCILLPLARKILKRRGREKIITQIPPPSSLSLSPSLSLSLSLSLPDLVALRLFYTAHCHSPD